MAFGYTHYGLEFREKVVWTGEAARPAEMEVLLYNDDTDDLSASDDLADITTEPSDGSYARQTVALGTADITVEPPSGDTDQPEVEKVIADIADVNFDMTDTTGEVTAWGLALEFEAAGDDGPQNHLIARMPLEDRVELDQWSGEKTLEGARLKAQANLLTR